ncbi:hypothetical protein, partial [Hyalangium sp.]|uniref:hypothetical protein n=1 Tax=Hyalangium sp. TaxID=2028555 RepID=UPI002D6332BE
MLREEVRVEVDGVTERWRLEWRDPPELDCIETDFVTCSCRGFAYAESGKLDLIRLRPGKPAERIPLTPLFEFEGLDPEGENVKAVLRRWRPAAGDDEILPDAWLQVLARRKQLPAMVLGDYDHDGHAREFVLQTKAMACGMRAAVLIGVDRRDGRVRALGSAEHPERPLVLEPETWALLLKSARIESVEQPCFDHGSEGEHVVRVNADKEGLHATCETYECAETGQRGTLLSIE